MTFLWKDFFLSRLWLRLQPQVLEGKFLCGLYLLRFLVIYSSLYHPRNLEYFSSRSGTTDVPSAQCGNLISTVCSQRAVTVHMTCWCATALNELQITEGRIAGLEQDVKHTKCFLTSRWDFYTVCQRERGRRVSTGGIGWEDWVRSGACQQQQCSSVCVCVCDI